MNYIPKIGVIGSRTFNNYQQLESTLLKLIPFVLVSGGAQGADRLAERFADEYKLPKPIVHYPEKKYGFPAALFMRNTKIVEDSDLIIAFWDGKSKGKIGRAHV